MKAKIIACILFLLLASLSFLAVGVAPQAEACWKCSDGDCQNGGDGIQCHEHHFPNGSGVCWTIDGCVY